METNEINELLGLNKDEKIIEEFKCFLVETLPILGKIYLSEYYIYFYSNIIFFNRNISIPLNSIRKIELNNLNIDLELKDKDNYIKKYKFYSNDNIKIIFEKIKSLIPISLVDLESSDTDISEIKSRKSSDSSSDHLIDTSDKNNLLIEKSDEEILFSKIEPKLDIEICRKIININPKEIFKKYYINSSSETNFHKFYEWMGNHSNIKITDWEKVNKSEKNISEMEKYIRTENFTIFLKDVPFIDHSEIFKTSTYYIEKDGTYYINNSSKNEGIPFADCFTIEATIELHPYINNSKTVFRTYVRTNFLKYTFIKNMLISQTIKNYTEEINKWLEFIQEKGEKIEGDYVNKEKGNNITNIKEKYINDKEERKKLIKLKTEKNINQKNDEIFVHNIRFKETCKKNQKIIYFIIFLILILLIFFFYVKIFHI